MIYIIPENRRIYFRRGFNQSKEVPAAINGKPTPNENTESKKAILLRQQLNRICFSLTSTGKNKGNQQVKIW